MSSSCGSLYQTLLKDTLSALKKELPVLVNKVASSITSSLNTILTPKNITKFLSALASCSCCNKDCTCDSDSNKSGVAKDPCHDQLKNGLRKDIKNGQQGDKTSFVDFPLPFNPSEAGPDAASTSMKAPEQLNRERRRWSARLAANQKVTQENRSSEL